MPFRNVHELGVWDDGVGDKKIYGFDLRLDVLTNQPPGAPQFQVAATQTFQRNSALKQRSLWGCVADAMLLRGGRGNPAHQSKLCACWSS